MVSNLLLIAAPPNMFGLDVWIAFTNIVLIYPLLILIED